MIDDGIAERVISTIFSTSAPPPPPLKRKLFIVSATQSNEQIFSKQDQEDPLNVICRIVTSSRAEIPVCFIFHYYLRASLTFSVVDLQTLFSTLSFPFLDPSHLFDLARRLSWPKNILFASAANYFR